jgi:hypothetical protein
MKQSYQWVKLAHDRGYRIKDGKCFNPNNKEIGYCSIDQPYKRFGLIHEGKRRDVFFHRLVAYQLYGADAFKLNVCIRHLDDDSLNNLDHNIGLGTHLDNAYDISPEKRIQRSLIAIQTRKRLAEGLDKTIIQEHKNGMSIGEISRRYVLAGVTIRKIVRANLLK